MSTRFTIYVIFVGQTPLALWRFFSGLGTARPQVDLKLLSIKDVAEAAVQGAGGMVKVHGKVCSIDAQSSLAASPVVIDLFELLSIVQPQHFTSNAKELVSIYHSYMISSLGQTQNKLSARTSTRQYDPPGGAESVYPVELGVAR